jgi:hypothetical protein
VPVDEKKTLFVDGQSCFDYKHPPTGGSVWLAAFCYQFYGFMPEG